MRLSTVLSVLAILFVASSLAKHQTGSYIVTERNLQFLGQFVYQTGKMNVMNFTVTTSNTNMKALLYYYSAASNGTGSYFYEDYEDYMTGKIDCETFSAKTIPGGVASIESGVPRVFRPHSEMSQYYWFLAVADCSVDHLNIEHYEVTYLQTDGDFWQLQFSWDEWAIGPFYIVSMIYYAILLIVHGYGCYELYKIEAYHSLIKLYSSVVLMQFVQSFLHYVHYSSFAVDGIGAPALNGIATLIGMAAQLAMMFVCILIAKGWAITSSYLTQKYLLLAITGVYILAYLLIFFADEFLLNPIYDLFMYESAPGIIFLFIRIATVGWFLWCLRDTLRVETNPEKREFYYPFGIVYGLWFISLPFVVLTSLFISDTWRLKVVTIIVIIVDAIGISILSYLFWPSKARNYFSIRTNPLLEKQNIKDENL